MSNHSFKVTFSNVGNIEFDTGSYLDLNGLGLSEEEEMDIKDNIKEEVDAIFEKYVENIMDAIYDAVNEVVLKMDIKKIAEESKHAKFESDEDGNFELTEEYKLSSELYQEIIEDAQGYTKQ